MKYCPITYEEITDEENYSQRGLHMLSPALKDLQPLNFTAAELRTEAVALVGKMSIQGIQSKLSVKLKVKEEHFALVSAGGHYILKPQSENYPYLPENEALTMTLAKITGLDIPVHGLVYAQDNSLAYFIKRFDRTGHSKKIPIEDFAQLLGLSRDAKYNSSMEKVISVISTYCSFPKIELVKLFKLTLFSFLVGNEDLHLKNFSLISQNNIVALSPIYDLLNSSIVLSHPAEELALSLNGKKRNLTKKDFLSYFAVERLGLNQNTITKVVEEFKQALPAWYDLIDKSFLPKEFQEKYRKLVEERSARLLQT